MAETISGECEFEAETSKIYLQTNLNGDTITIAGIHLNADNAASLAWLLQDVDNVLIEIKKVTE